MGLLASYLLDSANRSRAQDYASQQYGVDSPQAAFANAFPEQFAQIEAQKYQKQAEGSAIQQFFGGGQQQDLSQGSYPSDSALQQANQSSENPITWNQDRPQGAVSVPQGQSALAKYAAMAYLPSSLQSVAAQQMMFGGQGFGQTDANGAPAADVHGDAYLSTLSPQIAQQVKGLAEGKIPFPSSFALKSPYWQQMISAVSQYDPEFDAVNYQARAATRKDFTTGKSAQSINALNTVAQHISALKQLGDNLSDSNLPLVNAGLNTFKNMTGDPTVNSYDAAAGHVAEELTRAWRGAGGSEADIERSIKTLGHDLSPAQRSGALQTLGELVKGKVDALGDQYRRGMGTAAKDTNFYTPQALSAFKNIGVDMEGAVPSENAIQGAGNADPLEGKIAVNPTTGAKLVRQGGKWVPSK